MTIMISPTMGYDKMLRALQIPQCQAFCFRLEDNRRSRKAKETRWVDFMTNVATMVIDHKESVEVGRETGRIY